MKFIFRAGQSFPLWFRWVSIMTRSFYFNTVHLFDASGNLFKPFTKQNPPVLLYVSHRNGAADGFVMQKLHPYALSLLSIQLVVHPILKWFSFGIPVIRPKDKSHFGAQAKALGNPVLNCIRHIQANGSLCVYPEGTSEWGYTHLPYQSGGASMVRHLLQKGSVFEVRAVGLFYVEPDVFRSDVEIIVSSTLEITPKAEGESNKDWDTRIFAQMNHALDGVSVHCQSEAHFAQVSRYAKHMQATQGGSYGVHFINAQQQENLPDLNHNALHNKPFAALNFIAKYFHLFCVAIFMLIMAPVLLVGYWGGRKADAKNTVTFFRMIAGALAAVLWVPLLVISIAWSLSLQPYSIIVIFAALLGFYSYARVRHALFQRGVLN